MDSCTLCLQTRVTHCPGHDHTELRSTAGRTAHIADQARSTGPTSEMLRREMSSESRVSNTMLRHSDRVERCEHWTMARVAAKFLWVMCPVYVEKELVSLLIMANPCWRIMKFMFDKCKLSSAQQALCKGRYA